MALRTRFSHDAGRQAAHTLLAKPQPPTAIVCGNDVLAMGALSAARERGIAVPRDLTVIGFDDIPMAGWPLISLTTERCDLDALAAAAVELLLQEMNHPTQQPTERTIPVSLVPRTTHSTAPRWD